MIEDIRKRFQRYVCYIQMTEADDILRRYFVINSFDGLLVMLGIIMGTYVGGVRDASVLISAGIGAGVAMGVSGFFGVYMSEKAERKLDIEEAKNEKRYEVDKETYEYAMRHIPIWAGVVDGLSPVVAAAIALAPFMLSRYEVIAYGSAMLVSIALILAMLFGLGLFLSTLSKEHAIVSGMKMVIIGVVTAALSFLFGWV